MSNTLYVMLHWTKKHFQVMMKLMQTVVIAAANTAVAVADSF